MPNSYSPSDGTVAVHENCDWLNEPAIDPPIGAYVNQFPKFCFPHVLSEFDLLQPVFQYYSRAWTDPDSPPAWSTNPDDMQTEAFTWPGPILATKLIVDYPTPGIASYTQLKWRLAWLPHLIASADRPAAEKWNFFHMKWREAFYETEYTEEPLSIGATMTEKWWQGGIDALPGDFLREDDTTWPGTDWTEATIPTPSGSGVTAFSHIYPVWPPWQTWAAGYLYGGSALHKSAVASGLKQGLIPGGRSWTSRIGHPRINGRYLYSTS